MLRKSSEKGSVRLVLLLYNNGHENKKYEKAKTTIEWKTTSIYSKLFLLVMLELAKHIQGEKIKLQIWDTAGQERFRSITQSYYRSAHALILVFDVSNQPTFDSLLKVLVGNKTDRDDREIPEEIGEDFAQRYSMYYLETSAKSCDNVERLFVEIAQELLQQAKSKELPSYSNSAPTNLTTRFFI
ncbi:RAB30 [Lepeophtheirus salmonis]|uniref:RAB30 n=1 Tax=Lepeophtheirus salmonis TaxID=72036 RepID=A0A7R8H686_LEPSM|nr:RAB30 [Lepeophtheirus salmonis]CAF2897109.1 RAB30 [Lepeophtheirus salmonis]